MTPPGVSTIERVADVSTDDWRPIARRRRRLHRAVSGFLGLVMVGAVLDGFDVLPFVGPDEAHARARGGGFALDVEHPTVTRPALASVLRIRVTRAGGFAEPVQVAVSRAYLELYDLNGVLPSPSSETAVGRWVVWEFDPPPGDELLITYEARIEPGEQFGQAGEVAVLVDDEPVARVSFRTAVRP
jgi:hypothetical protein